MVKYLYICVFSFSLLTHISAQPVSDSVLYNHSSVRSLGMSFPSLNYPFLSPLNYSGYALATHSTRFRDKPKHLTQIQLHFGIGGLHNQANDSYVVSLSFHADWSRHWYLTDKNRPLRLLLGGSAGTGIDVFLKEDNTNNPTAYFFNLSLSPSILGKYRFNINNLKIELGQQLDIPALSLVSSSGYSTSIPYTFIEEKADFFELLRVASFGSFIKCVGITSVDIVPPRQRRQWPSLRISYIFSGLNYDRDNSTVKFVDQAVMVGAIFRMAKY